MSSMSMEAGGKLVSVHREIDRKVKETIARLKCGKAIGIDGIISEMLKYSRDAVVE